MKVYTKINDNMIPSSSIALGYYDGLHFGHKKVLMDAIYKSKNLNSEPTVLTFANHPVEVLWNVRPEFITTLDERLELFKDIGIKNAIVLDFTKELAGISAQEYLENIILKLNPKSISIGYNHHFGENKSGNEAFLKKAGEIYGFDVSVVSPVQVAGETVSSTLIRNLIKTGHTVEASEILGRMYKISNKVIKGKQRGRTIGFPTANLTVPARKIVPEYGVYTGVVKYQNCIYKGIINIGLRPTFADLLEPLIEVHILDFNKDIYGEVIEVSFYKKIRNETKFSSIDELKVQIHKDLHNIKNELIP